VRKVRGEPFRAQAADYQAVIEALRPIHPEVALRHWYLAADLLARLPPSRTHIRSRQEILRFGAEWLAEHDVEGADLLQVARAAALIDERLSAHLTLKGIQALADAGYLRFRPDGEVEPGPRLWDCDGSDLPDWIHPDVLPYVRRRLLDRHTGPTPP